MCVNISLFWRWAVFSFSFVVMSVNSTLFLVIRTVDSFLISIHFEILQTVIFLQAVLRISWRIRSWRWKGIIFFRKVLESMSYYIILDFCVTMKESTEWENAFNSLCKINLRTGLCQVMINDMKVVVLFKGDFRIFFWVATWTESPDFIVQVFLCKLFWTCLTW